MQEPESHPVHDTNIATHTGKQQCTRKSVTQQHSPARVSLTQGDSSHGGIYERSIRQIEEHKRKNRERASSLVPTFSPDLVLTKNTNTARDAKPRDESPAEPVWKRLYERGLERKTRNHLKDRVEKGNKDGHAGTMKNGSERMTTDSNRVQFLYQQGLAKGTRRRSLPRDECAAVKRRMDEEELAKCTFSPKTNERGAVRSTRCLKKMTISPTPKAALLLPPSRQQRKSPTPKQHYDYEDQDCNKQEGGLHSLEGSSASAMPIEDIPILSHPPTKAKETNAPQEPEKNLAELGISKETESGVLSSLHVEASNEHVPIGKQKGTQYRIRRSLTSMFCGKNRGRECIEGGIGRNSL